MAPVVGSYGSTPQPIPRFQHPSHELLQDNGFTQQLYSKYHNKCLKGLSKLINVHLSVLVVLSAVLHGHPQYAACCLGHWKSQY